MDNIALQTNLRRVSPLTKALSLLDKTTLVFIATFVGLLATSSLTDPDYFWHLKTGEFIVTNGALPSGDIFSLERFGQEWVLHEWLFEVILYGIYVIAGEYGVRLMTVSLGMLALLVVARCALRVTADCRAALFATALVFIPFASGITPRPQLISYCLIAYYLSVLVDFKYRKTNVSLLWIPVAMIFWVNAHGGFLVGVAFLFAFTACEWLRAWLANAYADPVDRQRLVRLTRVCGLTLAATLANPDFIWHWAYPVMVLNMKANAMISEWHSPNFQASASSQAFLVMVSVSVLANVYASRKRDVTEIAIPGLFILNAFISMRHIALASLVTVPFIALALHDGVAPKLANWWRDCAIVRALKRIPGAQQDLGSREHALNWLLLLVLVIGFVAVRPIFNRKEEMRLMNLYPVKAVDYVIANNLRGRMYNEYNHGGYLIYRLAPHLKVFIDGRADVYGDDFIADYEVIASGVQGWQEKFAALEIDFAILSVKAPTRQLLMHVEGFREVYADKNFAVLVRDPSVPALTPN